MSDVRILIVASDPLARAGLAALLTNQPGCVVAGQAAPGGETAAALAAHLPDVILWDLGWNAGPALEALSQLSASTGVPSAALLADPAVAAAAWAAGARALLLRDAAPDRLAAAVTALAAGLAVLDPAIPPLFAAPANEEAAPLVEEITPREREVLQLLAQGLPNKIIAQRLGISEHTVKFHVNAILGKLGVQSRTEAVVRATRLGLVLL